MLLLFIGYNPILLCGITTDLSGHYTRISQSYYVKVQRTKFTKFLFTIILKFLSVGCNLTFILLKNIALINHNLVFLSYW